MNDNDFLHFLSDKYEKLTGKQGLLYVSRPSPNTIRYVFPDRVCISESEALDYMQSLAKGILVAVSRLPKCDIHNQRHDGVYDAKTKFGPWANMCELAFRDDNVSYGKLGTGWGQNLYVRG